MDETRKTELLKELVEELCAEREMEAPRTAGADELWTLFRALVNTRPPAPIGTDWLAKQDELLQAVIAEKDIATLADAVASPADPRLLLWRGDITTLRVDAIVNAANSQMLGCWQPGHHCIDNAIHTFAGVQLRAQCDRIMRLQGHEEPTGSAKVTPAYNLPSKFVVHTVGPIVSARPAALQRAQLASCYTSCLDVATTHGCESIAFCCVSTGVFGYPQDEAARVAVESVQGWLEAHGSQVRVVFDVFGGRDEAIYRGLLGL